jgi:carbon monoxide dehydrogenase subunit G
MDLNETHLLPVAQARAWEALNDTAILKQCIPGCDSFEADGENTYAIALVASVGPVKARFKGRLQLEDVQPPNAYTLRFEGQGGVAGFAKGGAHVMLEPDGDAAKLTYTAHAQVGGKLAQIGSRLVDGVARKIAAEFFKRFGAALAGGAAAQGAAEGAAPPAGAAAAEGAAQPGQDGVPAQQNGNDHG